VTRWQGPIRREQKHRSPLSVAHLTSINDQATTADAPVADLGVMVEPICKHARKPWLILASAASLKVRTTALHMG
jgi:hypothetical protein